MGRQRNEETIKQIRRAVWQLFLAKGYGKTSFSDVTPDCPTESFDCPILLCEKRRFLKYVNGASFGSGISHRRSEISRCESRLERYLPMSQLYLLFLAPELRIYLKKFSKIAN